MKAILFSLFITALTSQTAKAQNNPIDQSFLFDESDIVVRVDDENDSNAHPKKILNKDLSNAVNQAKNILKQKPAKLPTIDIPELKNKKRTKQQPLNIKQNQEAPFGLFWGANQASTLQQGVSLQAVKLKNYENSFLATSLPKPIDFFDRTYVVFGKDDELYRILTYSKKINDDSSAQKTLDEYNNYSKLLEKKYGNKQSFFTPAIIEKTITNKQNKPEIIKEEAPLGNPDFLNQLASGNASLYSTYENKNVAAALSISVDGEKKSYIVIDYKNLKILQKQEAMTLDAL